MKQDDLNQDELIFSYLNSEISDEEKVLFENILNNDKSFKVRFNGIKVMMESLQKLPNYKTSINFEANLNSRIKSMEKDSKIWNIDISSIYNGIGNYFFNNRIKSTLGFSFILLFLSVFFISRFEYDIHNNITNNSHNIPKVDIPQIEVAEDTTNINIDSKKDFKIEHVNKVKR